MFPLSSTIVTFQEGNLYFLLGYYIIGLRSLTFVISYSLCFIFAVLWGSSSSSSKFGANLFARR